MATQSKTSDSSYGDSRVSATLGAGERSQTLPCARAVPRVLVAESDRSLRDLIADVFAFEGYFVTEADDDASVMRYVRGAESYSTEQFDLVVLGFQPQGAPNIATLIKLRASGCQTPVIVLTARPKAELAPHLNELDALCLSKPFALENLRVLANHVIRAHQYGFGHVSPTAFTLTSGAQGPVDSHECSHSCPKDVAV